MKGYPLICYPSIFFHLSMLKLVQKMWFVLNFVILIFPSFLKGYFLELLKQNVNEGTKTDSFKRGL